MLKALHPDTGRAVFLAIANSAASASSSLQSDEDNDPRATAQLKDIILLHRDLRSVDPRALLEVLRDDENEGELRELLGQWEAPLHRHIMCLARLAELGLALGPHARRAAAPTRNYFPDTLLLPEDVLNLQVDPDNGICYFDDDGDLDLDQQRAGRWRRRLWRRFEVLSINGQDDLTSDGSAEAAAKSGLLMAQLRVTTNQYASQAFLVRMDRPPLPQRKLLVDLQIELSPHTQYLKESPNANRSSSSSSSPSSPQSVPRIVAFSRRHIRPLHHRVLTDDERSQQRAERLASM